MKQWCFLIDPGIRETLISNTLIPCSALLQLLQGQYPCTTNSEDLHASGLIITNHFESLIELLSILAAYFRYTGQDYYQQEGYDSSMVSGHMYPEIQNTAKSRVMCKGFKSMQEVYACNTQRWSRSVDHDVCLVDIKIFPLRLFWTFWTDPIRVWSRHTGLLKRLVPCVQRS